MALLQQEDALNAARKADDMMGFGNGMNAPAKNAIDSSAITNSPSAVSASLSIIESIDQKAPQDTKSKLERNEIEYKNGVLTYQKMKLLQVYSICNCFSQ